MKRIFLSLIVIANLLSFTSCKNDELGDAVKYDNFYQNL
ncbi:MAG: hypothetical protein RIS29_2127, partial [Bacteroidota bacterium]